MKEETKKSTRKSSPKKATTKKDTAKKSTTKKDSKVSKNSELKLNETIKPVEETKSNEVECIYCHKSFEKGYTICPHCHKKQKSEISLAFFIAFIVVFLLFIICFHFIDKYVLNVSSETDFKKSCELISYENLVRHPKDYKNENVKVIGEVINVEGYDDGFGNNMVITINANLFENGNEQLITVNFNDKKYEQGFLVGDLITVYGKYASINGNIPNISAKYVVFGKK